MWGDLKFELDLNYFKKFHRYLCTFSFMQKKVFKLNFLILLKLFILLKVLLEKIFLFRQSVMKLKFYKKNL